MHPAVLLLKPLLHNTSKSPLSPFYCHGPSPTTITESVCSCHASPICQWVLLKHEYFPTAFSSWTGNIQVGDPNPLLENCVLSHSRLLWWCNISGGFSSVLHHKKWLYINHRSLKNHTSLLQALYKAIVKDRKFIMAEFKIYFSLLSLFHPQNESETRDGVSGDQRWNQIVSRSSLVLPQGPLCWTILLSSLPRN